MCGIIAYSGHRPALPVILDGLKRLEYRGYDSAGLAFAEGGRLQIIKSQGKLSQLEDRISQCAAFHATSAVGHTRWATHGLPTEQNAHPHQDNSGKLALVHNGIIENYQMLRSWLEGLGYMFESQTDTEVLVHLISHSLKQNQDIPQALSHALHQVQGSYALALINLDSPREIWAARHSSPLILGLGVGENFLASDIPAFLPYTREVVFLEDQELVHISSDSWQVLSCSDLEPVQKTPQHISWDIQAAQKSGYKHFMQKEICEQPQVIQDCLTGRISQGVSQVTLPEIENLQVPEKIHIVACGTSFHAGMWAKYLLERWARIPVQLDLASEFRYREPILESGDLCLVISQSGETADTLAGLRLAQEKRVPVLGICNVLGSSVARESNAVLFTQAGPEISVASTKAMCSQMVVLLLLTFYWAQKKATLEQDFLQHALQELQTLPSILEAELQVMQDKAQQLSSSYSKARSFFFLGRGLNYPLALEGALKLKEISYIHAEGYAAGEMKHGPIALIDQDFPTLALAEEDELLPKLISNLEEVRARGGPVICLTNPGVQFSQGARWELPKLWGPLNSFLILPALQLFAYQMAVFLGKDVDQPRNLAKSVTVE
ncbi:MAG: glutamine--fructose-6-phosphate transaminase (isomerizing) [Desulfohalobiaceae bacterium]